MTTCFLVQSTAPLIVSCRYAVQVELQQIKAGFGGDLPVEGNLARPGHHRLQPGVLVVGQDAAGRGAAAVVEHRRLPDPGPVAAGLETQILVVQGVVEIGGERRR